MSGSPGRTGEYGHVSLRLQPRPPGTGFSFASEIVDGAVPDAFVSAVEKGVREQMSNGILAGFPVVDVEVTLVGGSCHEVDSSEASFKMAAAIAFREGFGKALPVLLEPVMKVEIVTPEQFLGDVNGDLSRRRGVVEGMDESVAGRVIRAEVPLAEMFGYATSLRSLTQGRATYSMKFARYAEVPSYVVAAASRKH